MNVRSVACGVVSSSLPSARSDSRQQLETTCNPIPGIVEPVVKLLSPAAQNYPFLPISTIAG
jgi:hypothetical protein